MYQTNQDVTIPGKEPSGGCESLPLTFARRGTVVRIVSVPAGRSRTQLIRLGIMKGEVVRCIERLPGGTVVIEKNRQEIAIGASLAKTILVESSGGEESVLPAR
jgi:Fe2+ transport system protein FeoA